MIALIARPSGGVELTMSEITRRQFIKLLSQGWLWLDWLLSLLQLYFFFPAKLEEMPGEPVLGLKLICRKMKVQPLVLDDILPLSSIPARD
jgi:hypothetical protein